MAENWILLIDPFRNLVNAYRLILEGQGYFFETARNLNEAIQKLSARAYSVILTEYFPPFEETYLMIQKVKQTHPETSVVMITNAIIDEASYEKLFDAGLDDIVFKPYSPEKIIVHLKKGLRLRDLILRKQELETQAAKPPYVAVTEFNLNPLYFTKCLRQELKRAKRHQHPLSLVLIEIPNPRNLADQLETLFLEVAKILRKRIREEDIIGRDNGHFGILLPETDQTGSKAVVQRLSDLVQAHPSFQSDKMLRPLVKKLSFRSFSYPEKFVIPESLKGIVEEVNREYSRR
jgi:diguanylate cyclase (GGDEF)-like protein